MAKKKDTVGNGDSPASPKHVAQDATPRDKSPNGGNSAGAPAIGQTSPLVICRNKHWRYISSFHGPWLQLPLEALESLAHANYTSRRPRPIDPAVFFDLVKIRRLVGEATPLTVNAANGFGHGKVKLSHERKHRMRDQATKRLSQAYRIDEIATSVAIMQGTTSLENVAELVLEKKAGDIDANYVHFFHEKIPSRRVIEWTSFEPLNNIVDARPMEPEYLRTRSILRVFGEDFDGAVSDLTSAMQLLRYHRPQHKAQGEIVQPPEHGRRLPESNLADDEQPTSLEMQLIFQRAAAYLSKACQYVYEVLPPSDDPTVKTMRISEWHSDINGPDVIPRNPTVEPRVPVTEEVAKAQQAAARKLLKTTTKRALRDYMSFLDNIEYSPNFTLDEPDNHARKKAGGRAAKSANRPVSPTSQQKIYKVSQLFDPTPLPGLPPYPASPEDTPSGAASQQPQQDVFLSVEYTTYHPLLLDVLHAVLLCHILLQTSTKELQRHAYMVARLSRVTDGYPVFQISRSPARADWMEVLRRVDGPSWLNLPDAWEVLCRPAPLFEIVAEPSPLVAAAQSLVAHPEAEANSAAKATVATASDEDTNGNSSAASKSKNKEYPIWTERAAAIVHWIKESPNLPPLPATGNAKKKKKAPASASAAKGSRPSPFAGAANAHIPLELRPGPPCATDQV